MPRHRSQRGQHKYQRLTWRRSASGMHMPNCRICLDLVLDPGFAEAVASVALGHPGADSRAVVRRAVEEFHANAHTHVR